MAPPPRPKLTHFLCIPLVTPKSRPQLEASLAGFRDTVLKDAILPERAIRPLSTLHLTLGVMSLLEESKITAVLTMLRNLDMKALMKEASAEANNSSKPDSDSSASQATSISPAVKNAPPMLIALTGLQSMHTPTNTSVLYTSPSLSGHTTTTLPLYKFSVLLRDAFVAAGFIVHESRPLLLHATIVNTIYAPGVRQASGRGGGHGNSKAKLTFDATELMKEYEDTVWMEDVPVETVAICRMGARRGADGEERYEVEGEVPIKA